MASVNKVYDGNNSIAGIAVALASGSRIVTNDRVTISGSGTYDDANVATGKAVLLNVALTGADANNYALTSTQLSNNTGTITQLASVTWVGPSSGGYWSNASNWAGGAIPNFNNVAQVVIPSTINVIYDPVLMHDIGSSIVVNGTITFNGNDAYTFRNQVSGSGIISQAGVGALTLTGNNTHTGGTSINGTNATLIVGAINALGSGSVISSGGKLRVATDTSLPVADVFTLPSLTVNGAVTLGTNIKTTGAQVYNGAVSLVGGVDTVDSVTPTQTLKVVTLSTSNADITFNSTLNAGVDSLISKRSVLLSAGTGKVTFNDYVGASNIVVDSSGRSRALTYREFLSRAADLSPYQFEVNAATILIKGDITTFERQIYRGDVKIGDNGTNGLTRILLSEDPSIQFFGKVDDVLANTHGLLAKAVSIYGNETPDITFFADVGSVAALASLDVELGQQNQDINIAFSDISINDRTQYIGNLTIAGNVSTSGNQAYTANVIKVGDASVTSSNVPNTVKMTSTGGSVTFNTGVGVQGVGLNPRLEVLHGDTGNVTGLPNASELPVTTGLYNPLPVNEASPNFDGAAFFSSLVNQSVDRSSSSQLADEVVEVGEVGLLENGVLKRIDNDVPCDPKIRKECAIN